MANDEDDVKAFIEVLPDYFRAWCPLFSADMSKNLQDVSARWNVFGAQGVVGEERELSLLGQTTLTLPWGGKRRYEPMALEQLATAAADNPEADKLLRRAIADLIGYGEPIPPEVRPYAQELVLGTRRAPPKKRGQKAANHIRNAAIIQVVAALVEAGFKATRNEATRRESACSIVRDALEKANIHMGEDAVEKIWGKRQNSASD
jgi:hypothetical protein